jgi:hypothetical protein
LYPIVLGLRLLLYLNSLTIEIHILSNTFRTAVENKSQVRKLIEPPEVFKPLPEVKDGKLGDIPTIADLGVEDKTLNPDVRSAFPFKGGETAAVERLNYYYWKSECVAKYKETRNGLIGEVSLPVKFLYPFVLKFEVCFFLHLLIAAEVHLVIGSTSE